MVQKGLQVGIFGRELYKAGKGTINWIANKTIKRAANSATGTIEHTVLLLLQLQKLKKQPKLYPFSNHMQKVFLLSMVFYPECLDSTILLYV